MDWGTIRTQQNLHFSCVGDMTAPASKQTNGVGGSELKNGSSTAKLSNIYAELLDKVSLCSHQSGEECGT